MVRIQFDGDDVDLIIVIKSTRSRDKQRLSQATQEVVIVEKKEEINSTDTGAAQQNWKQPAVEIILIAVLHIIFYLLSNWYFN